VACAGAIRVRQLGGDRAGEMRITRLLRNRRVTVGEIFGTAAAHTAGLVAGRHVLAIQDTTSLRDDGAGHSLNLHAMIAVDATNLALLGLLHGRMLVHRGGQAAGRKGRPHAAKESHRWHAATCAAAGLRSAGAAAVTVIADREGDIFEDFALRPEGVHLLVRAAQDRALAEGGTLFTCLAGLPELGRMAITLPAAPGRPGRTAKLALRVRRVTIRRPASRTGEAAKRLAQSVPLTLIEAREIDPPPGATPAHWRLLTSHAAASFDDARRLCGFYRARWTIEQVFRTLKSQGFAIEALRIADTEPFQTLAAAALLAAIRVMQMVQARDGAAGLPLRHAFMPDDQPALEALSDQLAGKTARQKNPHPKGSLAFAAWVCARLGGWTGYYGKPGPIVLYNGLRQFHAIQRGFALRRIL
jgi:hypothetical protein